MLNYTALRPSVLSRPDLSGPHRKLARGIRLTTIVAGLACDGRDPCRTDQCSGRADRTNLGEAGLSGCSFSQI